MKDISLIDLLEAGCHFGHKVSKWHPKAQKFIYQEREGLHIIDLAQSRDGLRKAAEYVKTLGEEGKRILFVATKRQAKGVVTEAAKRAQVPYLTSRWIGGFMTNWEEVKKNIDKLNRMRKERTDGAWKKFPKHEIVALEKTLRKIESVYAGVADLVSLPDAIFIIDVRKEIACMNEALAKDIPVVAISDTNTDPNSILYAIPGNDDAVGSIKIITDYLAESYIEGRNIREKAEKRALKIVPKADQKAETEPETEIKKKVEIKEEVKVEKKAEVEIEKKGLKKEKRRGVKERKPRAEKKRGRPKKVSV